MNPFEPIKVLHLSNNVETISISSLLMKLVIEVFSNIKIPKNVKTSEMVPVHKMVNSKVKE